MPPVGRQGALKIAEDYLKAHPHPNCNGIQEVATIPELEEFMIRRPSIYGLPTKTLRRCRIAYARRPADCSRVAGSDIIIVAQETGEVVFVGSANDKG